MFTKREVNTLIGLFYASSCTPPADPQTYHDNIYSDGDSVDSIE